MKLDQNNLDNYFGSGFFIKQVVAEQGVDALSKRVLAAADSELELDYLEMLLIAEARRDGVALANGDWGGPRPFPTLQRCLREVLPEAMFAALKPKAFYKLIAGNRSAVEAAILAARSIPVDEFYLNFERDIRALEDLSHACPACGSPAGEVCRTNSKSLTKPQNPSHNHKARPVTGA